MKYRTARWIMLVTSILGILISGSPCLGASGGPDVYGYTFRDSNETNGPTYQWIDISSDGTPVVTCGDDVASTDVSCGIGGPVPLGAPVMIYGTIYTQLVPAVNGYISSSSKVFGSDNTPDCPLPAIPDLDPEGLRLYPFHADLDASTGQVLYHYYPVSPHPHSCFGVSVFTWENVLPPVADKVTFQVLIFDNGDILYQYQSPASTSTASVGIQDEEGVGVGRGLNYACAAGSGLVVPAETAILFEPPVLTVIASSDLLGSFSLRQVLQDIPPGGKIRFDTNAAQLTFPMGPLVITNSVTIEGQGPSGNRPRLSGAASTGNLFEVTGDVLVQLSHLDLVDSSQGNALQFDGSHLRMCEMVVQDTVSNRAVVVGSNTESVKAYRTRFHGNNFGGGLEMEGPSGSPSQLLLDTCEFAFCDTSMDGFHHGGALHLARVHTTILRSSFFNNSASANGGAISVLFSGSLRVEDSTFSANAAAMMGDAIDCISTITSSFTANVHRCTFVDNFGSLAGLELDDATVFLSRNVFQNTTVWPYGGMRVSQGYNLADDTNPALTNATDILNQDAKLGPLGPYGGFGLTHLPLRGSPLVDAAGTGSLPADQRGFSRPLDGDGSGGVFHDIGAVEAGEPILVTTNTGAAIFHAVNGAAPGQHVVFDPSFSGITITQNFQTTIAANDQVHIDATDLAEPITLDGSVFPLALYDVFGIASFHGIHARGHSFAHNGNTGTGMVFDRCRFSGFDGDVIIHMESELRDFKPALTVDKCVFQTNQVQGLNIDGDGLNNRITGSWFDRNEATSSGAGAGVNGTVLISGNTFSRNKSNVSGGALLFISEGKHRVYNNTFYKNAGSYGGAVKIISSPDNYFHHNTFVANRNLQSGGGGAAISISGSGGGGFGDPRMELSHNIFQKNVIYPIAQVDAIHNHIDGVTISRGYNLTDGSASVFTHTNDLLYADAKLSPLTWHNRAVMPTMYPLAGSPAIDGGGHEDFYPLATDTLGQPRIADGVLDGTNRIDIGAVEAAEPLVVTTHVDENDTPAGASLSLREALRDVEEGGRIVFDYDFMPTSVNNISLAAVAGGAVNDLDISKSLILDASNYKLTPGGPVAGITVSGSGVDRVLDINPGVDASIHGLSVQLGTTTLSGGGARARLCRFAWTQGTIYTNEADENGGGLYVFESEGILENMTVHGNDAAILGGGIYMDDSRLDIRHSTLTANYCGAPPGGANVHADNQSGLQVYSSIFAEPMRASGGTSITNIIASSGAAVTSLGYNLTDDASLGHSDDFSSTSAVLVPGLQYHGGTSLVRIPELDSPLVDQGPILFRGPPCRDARGFDRQYGPRVDIGAYEMGALNNLGQPGRDQDGDGLDDGWEIFYDMFSPGGNLDGDSFDNGQEYTNETHPGYETTPLQIYEFGASPLSTNDVEVRFTSEPYAVYGIFRQEDPEVGDSWIWQSGYIIGGLTNSAVFYEPFDADATLWHVKKF